MGTRRYGRYTVETSNETKVLFPDAGVTKGDVIDYYESVSDAILPVLRERAIAMERFPDGIGKDGFHQKQAGDYFPDWIETTRVSKEDGGKQDLVVCGNCATLAYLANQAAIELHPWLSRRDRPRHPDQLVFDLDPPSDDFAPVRRAARRVRSLLEELELPTFAKLTGSSGLHVVVPLDRREDFDAVRDFARGVARLLAARHPDDLTTEQRVAKRGGRLYLDIGRNAYAQTAVAAWSLRARPGAPVAAPIAWEELEEKGTGARAFDVKSAPKRFAAGADPWKGMMRRARSLDGPRRRLSEASQADRPPRLSR